jgi:hypothetical protein
VPYLLSYDTLALTFSVLLLLGTGTLDKNGCRFVQLVYWLPLIQIGLGNLHIPGPALIAPAFVLYALIRLRGSPASAHALEGRGSRHAGEDEGGSSVILRPTGG